MKNKFFNKNIEDKIIRSISYQIKDARINQEISQEDLSKSSGVSQPTISRLESGDKDIKFGTVIKVCNALNLKIELIERN